MDYDFRIKKRGKRIKVGFFKYSLPFNCSLETFIGELSA
jgi:hypothetical protein